eukprot:287178_1
MSTKKQYGRPSIPRQYAPRNGTKLRPKTDVRTHTQSKTNKRSPSKTYTKRSTISRHQMNRVNRHRILNTETSLSDSIDTDSSDDEPIMNLFMKEQSPLNRIPKHNSSPLQTKTPRNWGPRCARTKRSSHSNNVVNVLPQKRKLDISTKNSHSKKQPNRATKKRKIIHQNDDTIQHKAVQPTLKVVHNTPKQEPISSHMPVKPVVIDLLSDSDEDEDTTSNSKEEILSPITPYLVHPILNPPPEIHSAPVPSDINPHTGIQCIAHRKLQNIFYVPINVRISKLFLKFSSIFINITR